MTGAGAAGSALGASAAFGQDALLQSLIDQTQRGDFGQGFDSASRTIAMPKASLPTLSPATAEHTGQAIAHYEGIVSRGGWPEVPKIDRMRLGARNPSVVALRQRLTLAGDLDPNAGVSDVYDSYVDAAVRRFQARHGLAVDGNIREQTLKQLNVPAQVRLAQLRTNASRLKAMSGNLGARFVVCNIPAAHIEAIEGGVAVSRHTAVVGKPDRASPDINSRIVEINFNPYWTVPVSIVRRDLIPKMQAEPDYLEKNLIRIIDPKRQRAHAVADQLVLGRGGELSFQAGSGRPQLDGHDPHQLPELARRVHARHAVEEPVRRGLPFSFVRLRARAERARARQLAAGRDAGLVASGRSTR